MLLLDGLFFMLFFHFKAFLDLLVLDDFLGMLFVAYDQGFIEVEVGNDVLVFLGVHVIWLEHDFKDILGGVDYFFVLEVILFCVSKRSGLGLGIFECPDRSGSLISKPYISRIFGSFLN